MSGTPFTMLLSWAEPTDRDTFLINTLNEAVNADDFARNKTRAAVWRSGRCVHGGIWVGLGRFRAAAAVVEADIVTVVRVEVCMGWLLHIQKWHVPWLSTVLSRMLSGDGVAAGCLSGFVHCGKGKKVSLPVRRSLLRRVCLFQLGGDASIQQGRPGRVEEASGGFGTYSVVFTSASTVPTSTSIAPASASPTAATMWDFGAAGINCYRVSIRAL
eukprot:393594-Pleurochrysis_carterae.AAC.1